MIYRVAIILRLETYSPSVRLKKACSLSLQGTSTKKDSSALDAVAKEVSSVESGNFKDAQSFHELPTEAKGFEGQEYSNTTNELLFEKSSLVALKRSGDEVMPESRKRSTGGGESTGLIFSSSGAISSTSSRSSTRLSNTLRGSSKEQKWRDPHPIPDVNDNRDTVSLQEGRAFRENTPLKDTASLKDGIGGKHISSFREPWSSKKLPELPNMDDSQFAEVKPVLGYEKDNAKQDAIDKGKNKDVNIHSDPSHSSKPQETVNNNKASSPGFAPMTESSSSKNRLQKKDANPDVNKLNMAAAPSVGSNETVSTARNKYHGGKEDELVGDSTGRALDTKESKRKALKMKSDGQKGFPYSLRGKKKMSKSHEKAVEEQQNYTVDSPAPKISILHSDSSSILSGGEQTSMNVDEMYDKALEMAMKKNHPQSRGNAPGNSIDQPKPFLAPFVSDNSSQTISDPSQSEMRLTSEATSDATVGRQDSTSVPPVPVPAPTLAPAVTAIRNHAFTAPPHILNAPFQQPQSPSPKRKASFFGRLVKFSQENYGYQPRRLSNNSKGKTQKVIQVSSPHLPSTPLVEPLHASEKETLNTEITPSSSVKTLTSIKKKFIFGKLFKSS